MKYDSSIATTASWIALMRLFGIVRTPIEVYSIYDFGKGVRRGRYKLVVPPTHVSNILASVDIVVESEQLRVDGWTRSMNNFRVDHRLVEATAVELSTNYAQTERAIKGEIRRLGYFDNAAPLTQREADFVGGWQGPILPEQWVIDTII